MPVFGDFRKSRMREIRTSGSARGEAAHAPPLLYRLCGKESFFFVRHAWHLSHAVCNVRQRAVVSFAVFDSAVRLVAPPVPGSDLVDRSVALRAHQRMR